MSSTSIIYNLKNHQVINWTRKKWRSIIWFEKVDALAKQSLNFQKTDFSRMIAAVFYSSLECTRNFHLEKYLMVYIASIFSM
jgi:hypothetical protein